MAFCEATVNSEQQDWSWSPEAEEKTSLLQNPASHSRKREGGTPAYGAVFIVVNAALGAGLLNFPYAFFVAGGVVAGIVLQLCLVLFIIAGLVILAYCSQVSSKTTYQEVVRAACGQVIGTICDILIAVYTFGTCIAFLIIIGDQLDKIVGALMHTPEGDSSVNGHWYNDRKFTISVTSLLVILPLSIPKEIGFQKYASTLSVLGTWYVTIIVIVKYILPDQGIHTGDIPTSPSSWMAVFNAIPTICFGFQCHVSSVPVFSSMERPGLQRWGWVVTAAVVICLFVYTGTGVCGFLTFGSSVNVDVLLSYPSTDISVTIARASITLCVVTSYPILHFCGRSVIEGLWVRYMGEDVDLSRERRRRLLQTLVWFFLTLVLALFIPDIGKVISVIGGLAACFILVFPGLCLIEAKLAEIQHVDSSSWWASVLCGIFMVCAGAFIFGQSTVNSIYQDLRN
ncbi:sodium-coupled neutral amino acid transporter 7 [Hemiscyllium ocellatum]|uniref:sodium-coupled neutral amino acid transporter 7 n=1 Tax=Hemiscyllium ocellatum TaxID=170820 RepID=UPI00296666D6|nr:sodium-coupled neutral amino acid transporter 7 [Hemiscyllium ocellatum]XP_060693826.1 sodium-coupled neutral amino acid transporter 7 [Hemiscyllium ocellatum]